MREIDGRSFDTTGATAVDDLTNAFVLHPIACALAFIAAIVALGGFVGSLVGVIIATLAFIATVVVMAIDFAIFGVSDLLHRHASSIADSSVIDHQRPRQLRWQRKPRFLQLRHVDLSGRDGLALLRHDHRVLHLLH